MKCKVCGKEIEYNVLGTCNECHQIILKRLEAKKNNINEKNNFCTNCGRKLEQGWKFCIECGNKIDNAYENEINEVRELENDLEKNEQYYQILYKDLVAIVEEICQALKLNNQFCNIEKNLFSYLLIIYSHLLHFMKNYFLKKYDFMKSELVSLYMVNEFQSRFPDVDEDTVFDYVSKIITVLSSGQRISENDVNNDIYMIATQSLIFELSQIENIIYISDLKLEFNIRNIFIKYDKSLSQKNKI